MELDILTDVGFSRREARTYLALIKLGTCTVGRITRETSIPSSKIYEVLDRLIAKGFASYTIIKNQKHFQGADPETILTYINERKMSFEKIIPKIEKMQKLAKDKQEVELYVGKQAIFTLLRSLVDKAKRGDEYLSFSVGFEHDDPEIATFYANFTWRRKKKGLKIKVLTNEKVRKIYAKKYEEKILSTINNRFIDFEFPQGIVILNGCVVMLSWKNNSSAILLRSKNIAHEYKNFFYGLYSRAKQ